MNRTSPGLLNSSLFKKNCHKKRTSHLPVSKAIPGFIQYKSAEGLSPRTITGYEHDLKLWLEIQGDRNLTLVTTQELREYLTHMRTEYTPRRITGNNDRKLSNKTIHNIGSACRTSSLGPARSSISPPK
jgi:integrase/recombinase XerD